MNHSLLAESDVIAQYERSLGHFLSQIMFEDKDRFLDMLNSLEPEKIDISPVEHFFDMLCRIYAECYKLQLSLEEIKETDDFTLFLKSKVRNMIYDSIPYGHLFYLTHSQHIEEGYEQIEDVQAEMDEKERQRRNREIAPMGLKICKGCFRELDINEFDIASGNTRRARCRECDIIWRNRRKV